MIKRSGLYESTVYVLMIWTIFQDFMLGILYHFIHIAPLIKIIFFSKDILLVLLYIAACIRTKLPKRLTILQLCYIPFVLQGLFTSLITKRVSIMTALSATRGLMLLPAFLTIGYSIKKPSQFIDYIKKKYIPFLVFVAAIGILEYILDIIIGTKSFWSQFVQLGAFYSDIKGQAGVLAGDLPSNFYTYSSLGIPGLKMQKRLISFWAGPLTSGYCLLIPFMYIFLLFMLGRKCEKGAKTRRYLIILAVALFLTFTRGIILPALLVAVLVILYRYRKRKEKQLLAIGLILIFGLIVMIVYSDKIFGYLYNGSTAAHIISLTSALKQVSILGRGAGTFAAATTEGVWTESSFVSIAGQIGPIAMIIYMLLFFLPIKAIMKEKANIDLFTISIAVSGMIYFVTGIISGQLGAYTSIAPYYILAGTAMRAVREKKYLLWRS